MARLILVVLAACVIVPLCVIDLTLDNSLWLIHAGHSYPLIVLAFAVAGVTAVGLSVIVGVLALFELIQWCIDEGFRR